MAVKFQGRKIETAVFDLDGTMYLQEKLEKMWGRIRRELAIVLLSVDGGSPSDDEVLGTVEEWTKLAQDEGWRKSYERLGGDMGRFFEVADGANRAEYLNYDQELADVLNQLKLNSVNLCVFTGAEKTRAKAALNKLLGPKISLIGDLLATGDLADGIQKPDEEAFEQMLVRFSIADPQKVIAVDDWSVDLSVAKRLGMIGILVGESHSEENKQLADAWIPNIYRLMGLFE